MAENTLIKLGDKEVDLDKCLPMTLGNWEDFQEIGVVNKKGQVNIDTSNAKQFIDVLTSIIANAYDGITRKDVRKISTLDLAAAGQALQRSLEKEDEKPQAAGDPT